MSLSDGGYQLRLLGAFQLYGPAGQRIPVQSKRAMALMAALAMAPSGERSRQWAQGLLWGSRQPQQAQGSLRRELMTIRAQLPRDSTLLMADKLSLRLDLAQIEIDARAPVSPIEAAGAEFLEGIDLAGEEGFEDWLRDMRAQARTRAYPPAAQAPSGSPPLRLPEAVGRPVIAVLPFENLTADGALDFAVEALSDDLIEALSRTRWMPVISRHSSAPLRDQQPSAAAVSLGVRYILAGTVRAASGGAALALSLFDARDGTSVWTQTMAFGEQSNVATAGVILGAIAGPLVARVDNIEQMRAIAAPDGGDVCNLIWQGRWHLNQHTLAHGQQAIALLEQALELAPQSTEALQQLIYARINRAWSLRSSDAETRAIRKLAQRAMAADPFDGRGYAYAGICEVWARNHARARRLLNEAVELNPSLAIAFMHLGNANYLDGLPAAAIAPLMQALRLSPYDPYCFFIFGELAMAHWLTGDHDGACAWADRAITLREGYWFAHVIKIAAADAAMDAALKAEALRSLYASKPGFDPAVIDWIPFSDPAHNRRLKQALRD